MQHKFHGRALTIEYDDEVCIHAAKCVHTLPAVFDATRDPWIEPDAASVPDVLAAIAACPSGALQPILPKPEQH